MSAAFRRRCLRKRALHKADGAVYPCGDILVNILKRAATGEGLIQQFGELGPVASHQFKLGGPGGIAAIRRKAARGRSIQKIDGGTQPLQG